jgi:hypothetical protein
LSADFNLGPISTAPRLRHWIRSRIGKGCRECAEIGIIVLWPLYQMGADNEALFASGSTFSLLVCALSSRRHARSNRIRLQEILANDRLANAETLRDNEIYYRPVSSASNYSPRFRAQEASNKRIRRLIFTLTGLCRRLA